jgi:methyl-accepting chemotaxis protein
MSIPFILEVVLGLVFIYFALSLLASEIQEIIGTLLQWRAEHLKRSIEVLIAGNDPTSKAAAEAFADRLYDTPLVRSLNQEATGPIAHFFRLINQAAGRLYRLLTRTRNVFGNKTSGPSYIPAKTFSQALLDNLQIEDLRTMLLESRLGRFTEEQLMLPLNRMVNDLRASTANEFLLNAEFRTLETSVSQLVHDFREKRTTLSETIDRLILRLDEFTAAAQVALPDNHHLTETFMRRLAFLKQALASTALIKRLC